MHNFSNWYFVYSPLRLYLLSPWKNSPSLTSQPSNTIRWAQKLMTGASQAGNQKIWRRKRWQCEEKHVGHFLGSKWVYGSAVVCVDSCLRQTKAKISARTDIDPMRDRAQLCDLGEVRAGRTPVDSRWPTYSSCGNAEWLMIIANTEVTFLSYISFSTRTGFEVCNFSR